MPHLATQEGLIKHRDGVIKVAFAEIYETKRMRGDDLAVSGISLLGDTDRFLRNGYCLRELTQIRQGEGHIATREDGGKSRGAEALADQLPTQRLHVSPEQLDPPAVVSHRVAGMPEEQV